MTHVSGAGFFLILVIFGDFVGNFWRYVGNFANEGAEIL